MTRLNIYLWKIIKVLYFQTLLKSINAVLVSIYGKIIDIGALFNHAHEVFGCERAPICAVPGTQTLPFEAGLTGQVMSFRSRHRKVRVVGYGNARLINVTTSIVDLLVSYVFF